MIGAYWQAPYCPDGVEEHEQMKVWGSPETRETPSCPRQQSRQEIPG